jgi:single-stranded DNA-specific DHH superfamily exonuclease
MNIKFLIGNKNTFFNFIDLITKKDNIAILSHNDLDGLASAIFLEQILNNKKIRLKIVEFLNYKKGMFLELLPKLNEKKITKIFISDIGADQTDFDGFEKLRKNFDCFLIDHHPIDENLKNTKNIIKTESGDCVAYVLYELGEGLFERKKWEWLVCSAIITDMSYKKKEVFDFVRKIYPKITIKNIENSEIGELSKTISSALIYSRDDLMKIYNLLKTKNLSKLNLYRKIIDDELKKIIIDFKNKAEFYPDKKIYFYVFHSKYHINSFISTKVSYQNPNCSFVIVHEDNDNKIKASARNQDKTRDMNELMRKGIKGIENAVAGGHVVAAGASFPKKDLEKFKRNLLSS